MITLFKIVVTREILGISDTYLPMERQIWEHAIPGALQPNQ